MPGATSRSCCPATTSRSWPRSTRRSALPSPPDTLLIGIAPTGGKLPAAWRATILEAIDAGLDVQSGLHTFLGDDPEFAAAAAARGRAHRRLPAAAGPHGDRGRPPPCARQAGDPDGRHRLRDRQDVGRARAAEVGASRPATRAVFVPTGQTGMMIDGWGVAVDRLISDFVQGTVEWLRRGGRGAGRLDPRRGPGLARPPGVLVGDARAHPRRDAARDGHGPQAGPGRPRLRPPARTSRSRSRRCPSSSRLHEQVAGLVAPSKVVAVALNTSLHPDDDDARRVIDEIAAETGLPADDPVRFGGDRLWRVRARGCRGCGAAVASDRSSPRGPAPLAARSVPHRPQRPPTPAAGATTVVIELRDERFPGLVGLGEGYPDRFYGETPRRWRRSCRCCSRRSASPQCTSDGLARRVARMDGRSAGTAAAKCAIDIALHDLVGKVLGVPVHELLGLSADDPADRLHDRHRRAGRRRRAGTRGRPPSRRSRSRSAVPRTSRRCEAVREVFDGPIRVDANTGWTPRRRASACCRSSSSSASSSSSSRSRREPSATGSRGSRSARRCRSSPTRAP